MGLRKDETDLKVALDKAFDSMRKDGTYDKFAKSILILTFTAVNPRSGTHRVEAGACGLSGTL